MGVASYSLPSRLDMSHHLDSTRNLVILRARVAAHLLQQSAGLEEAEALVVGVGEDAEVLAQGAPPPLAPHHVRQEAGRGHRH